MTSPLILAVVFGLIGISLIISGGIIVGSVKKLSGDGDAETNIKNVGIIMNIVPGLIAILIAAYFGYRSRSSGADTDVSPTIAVGLVALFGLFLIISGGIVVGSIKKLSGDEDAKKNIKNVGLYMNLFVGIIVFIVAVSIFMYGRSTGNINMPSSLKMS